MGVIQLLDTKIDMFEELVFAKIWIVLPIWLLVYVSDYYLTILGARYYKAGVREHIVFQGSYELTPEFQADVDALRMVSPKFVRAVLISTALIVFLWLVSREYPSALFFFRFLCGGLILREVAVLVRHARNIALFRMAKEHQGITGQIRYERWLTYHISAVELISFAIVFLIVYLLTGSVSFLVGSALLVVTAFKHQKLSKMKSKEKGQQGAEGDAVNRAP